MFYYNQLDLPEYNKFQLSSMSITQDRPSSCECTQPVVMGVNQLDAATFVELKISKRYVQRQRDCSHTWRLPVQSLARLDVTAKSCPDSINAHAQYTEIPPACIATSFKRNFLNVIVQVCVHKQLCISEMEQATVVTLALLQYTTQHHL